MREGKSLFEKKKPKRLPHPYEYSWGISYEYLPGWPQSTEKEIIRLCLYDTIFIILKLYITH